MSENRYDRQSSIVPAEVLKDMTVTIIGVGAIGRQVALQLTGIGVNNLVLIDPDVVTITNLSSQGYKEEDLGQTKTASTYGECRSINQNIRIDTVFGKYYNDCPLIKDVIFCCVDDIETRSQIFESVKDKCKFFIDGRMAAETMRIVTAYNKQSFKYYPETIFGADKAFRAPCTAKSTIYCANVAAGFMVAQFTKWLRDIPAEKDVALNLLTTELSIIKQ